MDVFSRARTSVRSTTRRLAPAAGAVVLAGLVAAGCGSSGGDGDAAGSAASDVTTTKGPLSWLPADTWLVTSAQIDAKSLQEGIGTLGRLPIWSLAEASLPASTGSGLREQLLAQVAKQADRDGDAKTVTAQKLEAAFGDRVGMAIVSNDFSKFEGDGAPVAVWVEVDDEDAAVTAVQGLTSGKDVEHEHGGVTWYENEEDDASYLVQDGLLVVSPSPEQLEQLIDVHGGDGDSLADDGTGRAVLEATTGGALVAGAVATDSLLEGAAEWIDDEAKRKANSAGGEDATEQEQRALELAGKLGPLLETDAVDDLVADWIGASATLDDTGLRMRATWSNPRELADPSPGSRELVERMPADAPTVQATVSDGDEIGRIQDAWAEVSKAYDLDLDDLATGCDPKQKVFCDLGVEALRAVLEDESLAQAASDAGPTATVLLQDMGPLLAAGAKMSSTDPTAAATKPATAPKLDERIVEVATTGPAQLDWTAPAALTEATQAAGLVMTTSADGLTVNVRVLPSSPLGVLLHSETTPAERAALTHFGVDIDALLGGKGVTIEAQEVDGLVVAGFPQAAPSKMVPALEGDVDTLGDSDDYQRVVKAANPPKEVGAYGYVDLGAYVESLFTALTADNPDAKRILPTVRNNLADVPGILTWSAREQVDGHEVGVVETVVPILE